MRISLRGVTKGGDAAISVGRDGRVHQIGNLRKEVTALRREVDERKHKFIHRRRPY